MAITISTHNGSTVDLAHNLREKWRIDQENEKWATRHPGELRIDLSKEHEILVNRGTLAQVYHKLFDEALQEFNAKQIRSGKKERVIKNYLSEIRAKEGTSKAAKHPLYEIITQIGSMDNPVPDEIAKQILKEHAAGFEKRNPHLHVVCQALHADEMGGIHIHTSYIPVASDQKRGMRVQNSLTAALKQQGIEGDKYSHTAQMIWEQKENQALETVCKKYGYEVIHPQTGSKAEHLTVEEYKVQKQIDEQQAVLDKVTELPAGMTVVKKARLQQLEQTEQDYRKEKPMIDQAKRDLSAAKETMDATGRRQKELDAREKSFEKEVNAAANRKIQLMKDKALEFIKSLGLWDNFRKFVDNVSNTFHSGAKPK